MNADLRERILKALHGEEEPEPMPFEIGDRVRRALRERPTPVVKEAPKPAARRRRVQDYDLLRDRVRAVREYEGNEMLKALGAAVAAHVRQPEITLNINNKRARPVKD